jgi:hypothetical protein
MLDILIAVLVGCALGVGIGCAVRDRKSRGRRRRYAERAGEFI